MGDLGRAAREESEGAVHVQPRAVVVGEVGERRDRVEVAGVHLARVADQDRWRAAELLERAGEAVHVEPPRVVAGERADAAASDPEHPEGLERGRVDVAAREDGHRREAGEPLHVGVDVVPPGPPAPRACECDEVRHRRARGEHAAPFRGKFEQLAQPGEGDALELRPEGRLDPGERVLVDRGGEPVGAERGGRHASGHEVEAARARRCDRGVEAGTGEQLERLERSVLPPRAAGPRSPRPPPRTRARGAAPRRAPQGTRVRVPRRGRAPPRARADPSSRA